MKESFPEMSTNLEERLSRVEKQLAELKLLVEAKRDDEWLKTFGMFADDPDFDEMLRLGSEIRRRDRDDASD